MEGTDYISIISKDTYSKADVQTLRNLLSKTTVLSTDKSAWWKLFFQKANAQKIVVTDMKTKFDAIMKNMNKEEEEEEEDVNSDNESDDEDTKTEKKGGDKSQRNTKDKPKKEDTKPRAASETEITLIKAKFNFKPSDKGVFDTVELNKFCDRVSVTLAVDMEELKSVMSAVQFLGFKWDEVFNKLRDTAQKGGISKEMFIYHMRLLCSIYVERGSAFLWRGLPNLKDKTLRAYLMAIVRFYQIVRRRPSGGYKSDDVTITRIVAVFPDMTASIIHSHKKVPIAAESAPTLKNHVKFPGGASLIPKADETAFIAWKVWYKAFGKIINRGVEQSDNDINRYADAIHNSTVIEEAKRVEIYNMA